MRDLFAQEVAYDALLIRPQAPAARAVRSSECSTHPFKREAALATPSSASEPGQAGGVVDARAGVYDAIGKLSQTRQRVSAGATGPS